ncbi:MFS transporter [Sphingomonas sp.]|jgi:MFS family permease|uniref:MFS transporter n=1 Tax=Sphingomonas sp. TaxID=28214 RepID=UPI002FC5A008
MTEASKSGAGKTGMTAPLHNPLYRNIWLASLLSNHGLMIQGVGAAWAMTELTTNASMVALVQTATTLPILLLAMPAGAIADMYDRRGVSIVALLLSITGVSILFGLALTGQISAWALLAFSFLIGSGTAIFWPTWQSSVSDYVPVELLPSAVALNSISFNVARSFGPAVGGVIVAAANAVAAFGTGLLLYFPMLIVLLRSKRTAEPARLPPERLSRAVISGIRYVFHSPPIRTVIVRAFVLGLMGGSVLALLPLISRDLLGGDAKTFGFQLGSFGMGAVVGAFNVARVRNRFGFEGTLRSSVAVMAFAVAGAAISRNELLTAVCIFLTGVGWMLSTTTFNVAIQISVPRWVAGRSIASFQASVSGGIALGSWGWGVLAEATSVETALLVSAAGIFAGGVLGLWMRVADAAKTYAEESEVPPDPEVKLALTSRSGPIVIELEYRVPAEEARAFYRLMLEVQRSRQRNGAYGWSLARDVADPELWIERYHCPTWLDFLRQRSRPTQAERLLHQQAMAYHRGEEPVRVRRMLERPFGSVRWNEETRDRGAADILPLSPQGGN